MAADPIWHGYKKCAINGAKLPKANQILGQACPFCGNILGAYVGAVGPPLSPEAAPTQSAPSPSPAADLSPDARFAQLERLREGRLITEDEYAAKRQQIIDDL
jgi:hypothetical protein